MKIKSRQFTSGSTSAFQSHHSFRTDCSINLDLPDNLVLSFRGTVRVFPSQMILSRMKGILLGLIGSFSVLLRWIYWSNTTEASTLHLCCTILGCREVLESSSDFFYSTNRKKIKLTMKENNDRNFPHEPLDVEEIIVSLEHKYVVFQFLQSFLSPLPNCNNELLILLIEVNVISFH